MTGKELVLSIFPDVDNDEVEFILFEHTAYPMGTLEYNKNLLITLKETLDAGFKPCDSCNKPIENSKISTCSECGIFAKID